MFVISDRILRVGAGIEEQGVILKFRPSRCASDSRSIVLRDVEGQS